MNLTESQLFTIEALNRIDGFVWQGGAKFAAMDEDDFRVHFYRGEPRRYSSQFLSDGAYAAARNADVKHPDWRNSLITREQFDSVDGWVWNDFKEKQPVQHGTVVDVEYADEVIGVKIPAGIDSFCGASVCGMHNDCSAYDWRDIKKWRHHKPTKETEVQKKEKQPSIEELYEKYQTLASGLIDAQMQVDYLKKQSEDALEKIKKWHQERGFSVSVVGADVSENVHGGELNITDWRDLRIGDEIECVGDWEFEPTNGRVFTVAGLSTDDDDNKPIKIMVQGSRCPQTWGLDFKFIRRP